MKPSLVLFSAFILYVQPCAAVLPPLYEGLEQLKAIIDDPQLADELQSGEAIEGIEKNESGWEIKTSRSHLQVDVQRQPQGHPGPAQFTYQFHKAVQE